MAGLGILKHTHNLSDEALFRSRVGQRSYGGSREDARA
jgi:hypothetical protein